jgi:hypothetical protein
VRQGEVEVKVERRFDLLNLSLNLSLNLPFTLADFINILRGRMYLCQKMGGKERVVESVSAKDDLVASGELVDGVEDLIPCVLRHEADK